MENFAPFDRAKIYAKTLWTASTLGFQVFCGFLIELFLRQSPTSISDEKPLCAIFACKYRQFHMRLQRFLQQYPSTVASEWDLRCHLSPSPQQRPLLSIGELASAIGVSVVTLRRWDKAGKHGVLVIQVGSLGCHHHLSQ